MPPTSKVSGKIATLAEDEPLFRSHLQSVPVNRHCHPLGNVADADGIFSQTLPSSGDYLLKVEYIGMTPYLRRFSLSEKNPYENCGTIALFSRR